MTDPQRENILRKIRGLQAMTMDNGCTELEAIAAAGMMGRLLEQYNLTLTEVEIRAEGACVTNEMDTGRKTDHPVSRVMTGIAGLTNTKVWKRKSIRQQRGPMIGTIKHCFFGHKQDTLIAEYLYMFAFHALEQGGREATAMGIKSRTSYMYGMADRMCKTLEEMKIMEVQSKKNNCTSLLVVKDQVVQAEFQKLNLNLRSSGGTSLVNNNAYDNGVEAGAKVKFNPALSQRATKPAGMLAHG